VALKKHLKLRTAQLMVAVYTTAALALVEQPENSDATLRTAKALKQSGQSRLHKRKLMLR
jgi:pilus assembly protein TadC